MTKYGMAVEKQSSASEVTSNPESLTPGNNHGGIENSSLLITSHKLNGNNYLQWSQSVMMYVCGKGKNDYLTGEVSIPEKDDPKFRSWKAENHMVMSWLINSMNNDIGESFLLYGTAKEIWDAVRETFSSIENTAELFEIEANLHDLRQGDLTVTQYFSHLTRLWQQLDMFEVHNWKCSQDTALYQKIVEQKRTFKFLLGLNKDLDEVRGRVMGIKPLPRPREAFAEVRREESRKKVMMGSQSSTPTLEGSAFVARGSPSNNAENRQRKGRPWCDHCRKPGHLKETCWKIHGKPADWKPSRSANNKENRANIAASSDDTASIEVPLNKEQLEVLRKLFSQSSVIGSQSQSTNSGTSMVAQKGNSLLALMVAKLDSKPWILDSGASNHMTGDATVFSKYSPSNGDSTIRIANGTLSKVAGIGSVKFNKDLTLNSVLHAPSLDCNLVSVSKLTRDLNCVAKFFPTLCELQELDSGKMIGSADMCSRLYFLKDHTSQSRQAQTASEIKEMLSIVLRDLRFSSAVVHQEGLAAAFGNGLSTACIVNLGAQVTSVICVEDGAVLPMTQVTLRYGGEDISRCLLWTQRHHQTWPPVRTDALTKPVDLLMLNRLRESHCSIREGEVESVAVVHSYEDGMPAGSHKTRLTALNVPPMGLFYPMLLLPDVYPPPPRTWFKDHDDMLEDTWHTEGFFPSTTASFPTWESFPIFQARPKKEDNIGLAEAITKSILSTGRIDLQRKLFCSMQLIGGVALTEGLIPAVEERVLHAIPPNEAIDTVEVLHSRTNPTFVSWKGGAILGVLDFSRDAWIHREDWIRSGIHIGSGRKYKDSYFLQAQAMCYINS